VLYRFFACICAMASSFWAIFPGVCDDGLVVQTTLTPIRSSLCRLKAHSLHTVTFVSVSTRLDTHESSEGLKWQVKQGSPTLQLWSGTVWLRNDVEVPGLCAFPRTTSNIIEREDGQQTTHPTLHTYSWSHC